MKMDEERKKYVCNKNDNLPSFEIIMRRTVISTENPYLLFVRFLLPACRRDSDRNSALGHGQLLIVISWTEEVTLAEGKIMIMESTAASMYASHFVFRTATELH